MGCVGQSSWSKMVVLPTMNNWVSGKWTWCNPFSIIFDFYGKLYITKFKSEVKIRKKYINKPGTSV
jgi:hypothetical protein